MSAENEEETRPVVLLDAEGAPTERPGNESALGVIKAELERKTIELEHSLALLRATFEATADGILVTDDRDRITDYNRQYVRMWQLPPEVLESREHGPLAAACARQVRDPAQFLARVDEIRRTGPLETHDLLELSDGRIFERVTRVQFVGGKGVGRVWSLCDITERKRSERALVEEQERLRITLSSIGDGVVSTDAEGRVTFLNHVAETLTGWSLEDARGRPLPEVFQIVHEDTRATVENPALNALRFGRPMALANHTLLIARDGSERPIDDSAAPMRDQSGETVGAVLVFRDISERKAAEAARARLAAIVESSEDAIISKSIEDGRILSWNAGAERLFGWTAAEAIGRPITIIIPPERLDEERQILETLRRGERIEHFETVRITKDGRRLEISLANSPFRDRYGRIIGTSKVARDITEQRRAARSLQLSEERARLALDVARLGTWSLDVETGQLTADERCREICGFSASGPLGVEETVARIYPDDAPRVVAAREAALRVEDSLPFSEELRVVHVDGAVRWIASRSHTIFHGEGSARRPVTMIGTVSDITDRKRHEQELRHRAEALAEADRKKDEFLAMLAHELRNPLAPLRNGLQVMRLSGGNAGVVAGAWAMMDRQLSHMVRLIDDLMDVSRISRNRLELRRERVTLADVVSSAVETARPMIDVARHELTVSLPAEPVFLHADLTRLAQVLSNLLTNSAKYTEPGGHIRLVAERHEDHVVVSVSDNGIGIPVRALPTIFDMFSQVDRGAGRAAGGLGIGLALVKRLTEMHGGTVTASSAGPGAGSTFTVKIPVRDGARLGAVERALDPVGAGERRSILVVDDNADSATSMAMMLELLGHSVHTASDGLEAVESAERLRPDVVLMDLGMPRLDGLEATRRIREARWGRGMTIIALTGWGQDGDREQSRQAGCDAHLVKPVGLADLHAVLARLVRTGERN